MAGLKTRLLLPLAAVALIASAPSDWLRAGRQLYDYGDGLTVREQRSSASCAGCHGNHGEGGSEGGISAPSLQPIARLPSDEALATITAAVRDGQGSDGRSLLPVMPRFEATSAQLRALTEYVRNLPDTAHPGVDARTVRLAVDLGAAPLTNQQRHSLMTAARAAIEGSNSAGDVYGRKLVLAGPGEAAFLRIAWTVDEKATETVALRASSIDRAECRRCCGTLHPPLDTQIAAIRSWLDRQPGEAARRAIVVEDPAEADRASGGEDLYFFADDLSTKLPLKPFGRQLLVLPVDINRRMRQAAGQAPGLTSDMRQFNLVVEMQELILLISSVLARHGRRLSSRATCVALSDALNRMHRLSIVELQSGDVLASGLELDPEK